jgi:hypothetical protein
MVLEGDCLSKSSLIWCSGVLVPCRLVGRCQRFGETYCLQLQGWRTETLVSTYESTQRLNPEEHRPQRSVNLKSHRSVVYFFTVNLKRIMTNHCFGVKHNVNSNLEVKKLCYYDIAVYLCTLYQIYLENGIGVKIPRQTGTSMAHFIIIILKAQDL